MALSPNISVNNAAGTSRTFSSLVLEPRGNIRKDTASSVVEPVRMIIRHSDYKKGGVLVDRHFLSFAQEKIDLQGVVQPLVLSVSCSSPRSNVITTAMYYDLLAYARNWLGVQTNADAFYNGES